MHNNVPASLGSFPKLNPEFVVRANPDLIMVGDYNYIDMEQHASPAREALMHRQGVVRSVL